MGIEHVVVLMLENRSFDNMLGALYPDNPNFDGLNGTEVNIWHKPDGTKEVIPAWADPTLTPRTLTIPDPDGGESFTDFTMQIRGIDSDPRPMGGFVDNYMRQKPGDSAYDPVAAMHHFTPDQVPALSQLARAFGVSDRWFASAPNQTWPNRFFVHTGTANGYVDNLPPHFPYTMETVFNRLSDAGKSWKIYYGDFPQTATLSNLWLHTAHFLDFEAHFAADAANGDLPAYSFIEPRYFADPLTGTPPNDGHPPHNVGSAQQLIARVYNAVRGGPEWRNTLLIITCDEHGGCYDHVEPPEATPPGGPMSDGFAFDRFGVRVPTVIVSPHVRPGSILRASGGVPFDHTAIIATLRALHGFAPLTARDAAAPSILDVLDFGQVNDGPDSIPVPPLPPDDLTAGSGVPNGMQVGLNAASRALPGPDADIDAHCQMLAAAPVQAQYHPSVAAAHAGVERRFADFLSRAPLTPPPSEPPLGSAGGGS